MLATISRSLQEESTQRGTETAGPQKEKHGRFSSRFTNFQRSPRIFPETSPLSTTACEQLCSTPSSQGPGTMLMQAMTATTASLCSSIINPAISAQVILSPKLFSDLPSHVST